MLYLLSNGLAIKTVETPNGEEWFKADDVCKALGYASTKHALVKKKSLNSLIEEYELEMEPGFKKEGQQPYVSKESVCLLVSKCKNIAAEMIDRFDLRDKHINSIITVFEHERFETRFNIGSYRIDLYFLDRKLAIECDKGNRSQSEETARQQYIKNVLSCKFIRFNPDEKNFDILKVIGRIVKTMYYFE